MDEVLAGGLFDGRKVGQPHSCVSEPRDPRDLCQCISLSERKVGKRHLRLCVQIDKERLG